MKMFLSSPASLKELDVLKFRLLEFIEVASCSPGKPSCSRRYVREMGPKVVDKGESGHGE
jgi:hypothetical protein